MSAGTSNVHIKDEPDSTGRGEAPRGYCPIKTEYLRKERDALLAKAAAAGKRSRDDPEERDPVVEAIDERVEEQAPESKRMKIEGEPSEDGPSFVVDRKPSLEAMVSKDNKPKKSSRGQNKNRVVSHSADPLLLCNDLAVGRDCQRADQCRYSHDIVKYLVLKGEDLGTHCPLFDKFGHCKFGLKCRFAGAHSDSKGRQIIRQDGNEEPEEQSWGVSREFQKKVRKQELHLPRSETYFEWLAQNRNEKGGFIREVVPKIKIEGVTIKPEPPSTSNSDMEEETNSGATTREPTPDPDETTHVKTEITAAAQAFAHEQKLALFDDPWAPFAFPEINEHKKKVDFRGKTYLAPLTTVGNLPFRRICKGFGVDITCGEMAMANNLLAGQNTEWALCRRHKSEDLFGVQIAGSQAHAVVRCAEAIEQGANVDFIDLNVGCPVDSITRYGCGSALLEKKAKLFDILQGCNYALNVPITCKLRMGVDNDKPITHKLIDMLKKTGVGAITLHGRSKAQRYTKLADWNYIDRCAKLAGDDVAFFGNGDVLGWEDYQERLQRTRVHGVMIGRGALIKPWIFEEIKEGKVKDVSATERLDMLKTFANFGLEHWGSDTLGVNTTRRFMCDWLSFLYRYVPVGLLEVLPQRMNDRPPLFYGRSELETLMGSPNAADWVKITELILGKAPADFKFVPKSVFADGGRLKFTQADVPMAGTKVTLTNQKIMTRRGDLPCLVTN